MIIPINIFFLNYLLYFVQDPNVGDALRVVQVLGFNICDYLNFDYTVKITDNCKLVMLL